MNRYIHSRKAQKKSSKTLIKLVLWLLVPLIILLPLILWGAGFFLVSQDEFKHHTWGLVLEGQNQGMYRSEAAISLLKERKIDSLVFSGGLVIPNLYRSELYVEHAISAGIPEDRLFQVFQVGESTLEEAIEIIPFFRQRKIDTVVVVTSSSHSARAKRILNQVGKGNPVFIFSAIEDPEFDPNTWMLNRHSQAVFVLEWLKTINSWIESFGESVPNKDVSWHQGRSIFYKKLDKPSKADPAEFLIEPYTTDSSSTTESKIDQNQKSTNSDGGNISILAVDPKSGLDSIKEILNSSENGSVGSGVSSSSSTIKVVVKDESSTSVKNSVVDTSITKKTN